MNPATTTTPSDPPYAAPDPAEFRLERDGATVLVAGDVRTPAERDALRGAVADALAGLQPDVPAAVTVDIGRVGYLDSGALGTLVSIARRCAEVRVALTLSGVNEETLEQLRMTKIDQVFHVHRATIVPARPGA